MLWRGQQVVVALSRYRAFRGGCVPDRPQELVEGIDINGKRLHLLRPSAICDLMTPCEGEAKPTGGRSIRRPAYQGFAGSHHHRSGEEQASRQPQGIQELARFAQVGTVALPGSPPTPNSTASSARAKISRAAPATIRKGRRSSAWSARRAVRCSGLGIEEYDHALFFPNIPVMAGGFTNPFVLGSVIPGGGAPGGGSWRRSECRGSSVSRGHVRQRQVRWRTDSGQLTIHECSGHNGARLHRQRGR